MEKEKPLVSILTSCYNGSKYIDQYAGCLLSQTYRPLECIIVNDGSEDDSGQKLEELAKKAENQGIHTYIVHQENKGLAGGISTAFSHSKGEYVLCWDIDDFFTPDNVTVLANLCINNPSAGAALADGFHVDADAPNSLLQSFSERHWEFNPDASIYEQLIYGKAWNWAGCYIVRADILENIYGGRNIPIPRAFKNAQNLQLLLPASKKGCVYSPAHIMRYVKHRHSLTNEESTYEKQKQLLNIFLSIREEILDIMGDDSYKKKLEIQYSEYRLLLAYEHHHTKDFNQEFNYLPVKTLQHKLFHAIINQSSPIKVQLLRIMNKASRLLNKRM